MQIGELARLTGCAVDTIRYYEKQSLLPPPARSAGNFRDYADSHVERLRLIRHCRALDMSLDEIRSLLAVHDQPQADCSAVNALLDAHLGHVRARLRELQALEGAPPSLANPPPGCRFHPRCAAAALPDRITQCPRARAIRASTLNRARRAPSSRW